MKKNLFFFSFILICVLLFSGCDFIPNLIFDFENETDPEHIGFYPVFDRVDQITIVSPASSMNGEIEEGTAHWEDDFSVSHIVGAEKYQLQISTAADFSTITAEVFSSDFQHIQRI